MEKTVEHSFKRRKLEMDQKEHELKKKEKELKNHHNQLKIWSKKVKKVLGPIIKLNVGGHSFQTSLQTLKSPPNSMFSGMFSGHFDLKKEPNGEYFIDRDGTHFRHILNFLRDGSIPEIENDCTRRELLREAEYYGLDQLRNGLASRTIVALEDLTNTTRYPAKSIRGYEITTNINLSVTAVHVFLAIAPGQTGCVRVYSPNPNSDVSSSALSQAHGDSYSVYSIVTGSVFPDDQNKCSSQCSKDSWYISSFNPPLRWKAGSKYYVVVEKEPNSTKNQSTTNVDSIVGTSLGELSSFLVRKRDKAERRNSGPFIIRAQRLAKAVRWCNNYFNLAMKVEYELY